MYIISAASYENGVVSFSVAAFFKISSQFSSRLLRLEQSPFAHTESLALAMSAFNICSLIFRSDENTYFSSVAYRCRARPKGFKTARNVTSRKCMPCDCLVLVKHFLVKGKKVKKALSRVSSCAAFERAFSR
jgi:hypothetical protein